MARTIILTAIMIWRFAEFELLGLFRDMRIERRFEKAVEGRQWEEVLDSGDGNRDMATSFIPETSQR